MDNIELFAEKIKQLSSCNYHFTNGGLISIKKNDTNKKKVMGNVG